jgi:hypothetical protein
MQITEESNVTVFTASQLEQLCRPEQLERTLFLLFHLNHWAKARKQLFFVDRQGLYEIKAELLQHLYTNGIVEAIGYIDGIDGFGKDLYSDNAALFAAGNVIERLEAILDPDPHFSDIEEHYNSIACQFYTRLTGKRVTAPTDVELPDIQVVQEYIYAQLRELEQVARTTREPIPCDALTELCVAPGDLLPFGGRHFPFLDNWDAWDSLDESDLRKLDPEGMSLLAFRYASATASYVFHLPFRHAEEFLSAERLQALRNTPTTSREFGEYYGRAIAEPEILQFPIKEILRELGVDIAAVCPRQLADKQEYILARAMRYVESDDDDWDWSYDDDEEEIEEEIANGTYKPVGTRQPRQGTGRRKPECCPLCDSEIAMPGTPRIEHWRQAHAEQDLTYSQASWILNRTTTKQQFCIDCPPDYRGPATDDKGTRYWRLETLALQAEQQATKEAAEQQES